MYGQDILCGISKVPFEIPNKVSYPYIERYDFFTTLKFCELLHLRVDICFGISPTTPPPPPPHTPPTPHPPPTPTPTPIYHRHDAME